LTLSALLEASDLVLEDEPAVEHAIYSWKESAANFSDCLINARNRRIGCSATATFDRNALKVDGFMAA
jgi:predicted nucleic-acid-binding protein